jgi:hypothetical protein
MRFIRNSEVCTIVFTKAGTLKNYFLIFNFYLTMSRKIKNFTPVNPSLLSNDFQSLKNNFQEAFGLEVTDQSLVMFIEQPYGVGSSLKLIFAKAKKNGQPDLDAKTVSLALPCPPYCGQRDQQAAASLNVLTTT